VNSLDFRAIVADTPPEDLHSLLGRLVEAEELARGRLRGTETRPTPAVVAMERWLTPKEAANIAAVPTKRIYEWAQGKRWASRPTRRCLRIEEGGFRRWLAAR
jgi:hypothetical protein